MNSDCIDTICRFNLKQTRYLGTLAVDNLPRTLPKEPWTLIVNTDQSFSSGTHWIAMRGWEHVVEVFCSLGTPYVTYPLLFNFVRNICKARKIFCNLNQCQEGESRACGLHAI